MTVFITCAPHLEEVVEQELSSLGYTIASKKPGALEVPITSIQDVYKLNFLLRTASRVLLSLGTFPCKNRDDLYKYTSKMNWEPYFRRGKTLAIYSHVQDNPNFRNSLFASQVVKDAICDELVKKRGKRPDVDLDNPNVRLALFIDRHEATLSFDTSGRPLHMRGIRLGTIEAPIRENLAAALLLMAGYTGQEVLVDPCCGAGTFLLEAACIASNTPSQYMRSEFGFQFHPEFDTDAWQAIRKEAMSQQKPLRKDAIIGIERDRKTYVALCRTVVRSQFLDSITTINADFRTASIPVAPNFIITNPPYGKRLQSTFELESLYKSLGDFMKKRAAKPARGFILSGNVDLSKQIGLKAKRKIAVENGGIDCRFLEYDLY
jgi:putative N6-adenine-specific DNA methylase